MPAPGAGLSHACQGLCCPDLKGQSCCWCCRASATGTEGRLCPVPHPGPVAVTSLLAGALQHAASPVAPPPADQGNLHPGGAGPAGAAGGAGRDVWCLVFVCRVSCSSGAVLLRLVPAEERCQVAGTNSQISFHLQTTTSVQLLLHVSWQPSPACCLTAEICPTCIYHVGCPHHCAALRCSSNSRLSADGD